MSIKPPLTPEEERQKKAIYDSIAPRRRKFIDKMGYDKWDPFAKPFDPIDQRRAETSRTAQDIFREFMHSRTESVSNEYNAMAMDMSMGVINKTDRARAAFEFCAWYAELLKKEGVDGIDWTGAPAGQL